MTNTITLTQTEFDTMTKRISKLETMVKNLSAKIDTLMDHEPAEGTQEWWDWSNKKALEEVKKGKTIHFDSVEEMTRYLSQQV
jgi:hypothetical protein